MNLTGDKLAKHIDNQFGPADGSFSPIALYNADGDCIEFHLSNESYYAKRLDGWVTVYYGEDTGEVVGGVIKGVRESLLPRFPGLRIDIKGNRVAIACILRAPAYETGDAVKQKTYEAVIRKVEEQAMDVELLAV